MTTAFYSSIHFVEDFIFPAEVAGKKCDDILHVKQAYRMDGRHAARERVVFEKIDPKVGARYKWLDDQSRNARYKTYKLQASQALKAKEYLDYIYNHCYSDIKKQ